MNTLPNELFYLICEYLPAKDLLNFTNVNKHHHNFDYAWKQKWNTVDRNKLLVEPIDKKNWMLSSELKKCVCCHEKCNKNHFLNTYVCGKCTQTSPEYGLISRSVSKKLYKLDETDLYGLHICHIRCAYTTGIFFIRQHIETIAAAKHGSLEDLRNNILSQIQKKENLLKIRTDKIDQLLKTHSISLEDCLSDLNAKIISYKRNGKGIKLLESEIIKNALYKKEMRETNSSEF